MASYESPEAKSYRVNGFSESEENINAFSNNRKLKQDLSALNIDSGRINPILVDNLKTYIDYTTENLKYDIRRPIYYRVHANVNYINVPSAMRSAWEIEDENWIYEECRRKFPKASGMPEYALQTSLHTAEVF